jgi:N-acetylmuramoyl-L-alanine amidase
VAPTTPAVIIETGFLSSPEDRRLIAAEPQTAADGISRGILLYLARRGVPRPDALVPRAFPPMRVADPGANLRFLPGDDEKAARFLPAGTVVRPVGEEEGWVDLIVWGNYRVFGWMRQSELTPLGT